MPTLLDIVKSRTRSGWVQFAREKLAALRAWVQDNAERAALIAAVLGMAFVIFFKLVLFLAAVGVIAGYAVWYLAPEES